MNKQNLYESCEQFVNELYLKYPRLFKSMNEIIAQYQDNPSISKTYISQSLLSLLKHDTNLETHLYELLSTTQEVSKPLTLEEVQAQITQAFQIIQSKKPEKIMEIINFFQEKTKDQGPQSNAEEIQRTALTYFSDFFKEDREMLELITKCFEPKEKPLPQENVPETPVLKKRKLNNEASQPQTPLKSNIISPVIINKGNFAIKHHAELSPEELFFQNLRARLKESQLMDFCKIFFLYLENIISNNELFEQVKDFFPNESEFLCFRNMIFSKEIAHRKAAVYFKPYGESDLSSKF